MFESDDWAENWDYDPRTPWSIGTGHGSIEQHRDVIDELHAVVQEVTGKPVAKPPARRIGFY
ncbi:hypothetical protein [Burkholderia gladioli]|uniref:hypothetical protein n=1 Tax=Burkholderia gladioli TaxID=28095 RepID=UPI00264B3152|nr:hypothetical protein [Burkholderia gladioli]MDN7751753.1 hypothetical protein [Burkholderia gladioli]